MGLSSLEPALNGNGDTSGRAQVFREEAGSACWTESSSVGRLVVGGVVVVVLRVKEGGESMLGGDEMSELPMLQGKEDSLLSLPPLLASRVLAKGLLLGVLDEGGGVAGEEWSISARDVTDVHLWDVMRGEGSTQVRVLGKKHRRPVIYTQ